MDQWRDAMHGLSHISSERGKGDGWMLPRTRARARVGMNIDLFTRTSVGARIDRKAVVGEMRQQCSGFHFLSGPVLRKVCWVRHRLLQRRRRIGPVEDKLTLGAGATPVEATGARTPGVLDQVRVDVHLIGPSLAAQVRIALAYTRQRAIASSTSSFGHSWCCRSLVLVGEQSFGIRHATTHGVQWKKQTGKVPLS